MARAHTAAIARAQDAYSRQQGYKTPDCAGSFVQMIDVEAGLLRVIPIRCDKWACPYCAPIKLSQARLRARSGAPKRHIVLTLRYRPELSLPKQIDLLRAAFRKLVAKIRRTFKQFEYMAVLELQKNRTPHLHVLARGTYIPWRWLTKTWQALTGAWMVHIKSIKSERGAISELVKYLAKTAQTLQNDVPGCNVITTSRHWLLSPPDKDPGSLEHNWHICYVPWSPQEYEETLNALGASLDPVPGATGVFAINCNSPPSQDLQEAALRDIPSYLHDLVYFAAGTLRDIESAARTVRAIAEAPVGAPV